MTPPPCNFNADFLERRMREHREQQEKQAQELEAAIVSEVYVAIVLALAAQSKEDSGVFDA